MSDIYKLLILWYFVIAARTDWGPKDERVDLFEEKKDQVTEKEYDERFAVCPVSYGESVPDPWESMKNLLGATWAFTMS